LLSFTELLIASLANSDYFEVSAVSVVMMLWAKDWTQVGLN